jgi:hypothetical protein
MKKLVMFGVVLAVSGVCFLAAGRFNCGCEAPHEVQEVAGGNGTNDGK